MMDFRGKRVLVTGAGSGIGRELCRAFAGAGAAVVAADRNAEAAAETARLVSAGGGIAEAMTLDVTDPAAVAALPGRMNGPLDGLVNNAGVVYGGRFDAVPMERHAATLRVNAEGTVAVTHALLPTLRARPEAFLAFVVSASAFVPLPSGAVYAASKWAVLGFAESLAEELRLTGAGHVRVTAVCPGYVSTGLFEGARPPTLMRMLDAGEVAARTLSAVRRGRVVAAFPWPARLAPVLRALLPRRLCGWLFDRLGVSGGMTGWRGRGETPRPS